MEWVLLMLTIFMHINIQQNYDTECLKAKINRIKIYANIIEKITQTTAINIWADIFYTNK